MQQALARILVATAEAQPHIGYCQGMNFVAVQVLYTLAETRALSWDYVDDGEVRSCLCLVGSSLCGPGRFADLSWFSLHACSAMTSCSSFPPMRCLR